MKKLVGVVGNYVVGDRFWGRERELSRLLGLIEEGANISIIAQRRIGKTSLMHEAGNRILRDGYIPLHVDVQAAVSPSDLVTKLAMATYPYSSLWEKTTSTFANILSLVRESVDTISLSELEIQIRSGVSIGNWQQKGSQVLASLAAQDKRVVLFVDELPILIARMLEGAEGKEAVHQLLAWLREKSLEHQGRLAMVFAGSVGLEPVLSRVGLSADINHLMPFVLEPWSYQVAFECLQALAAYRAICLPEPSAHRMLELLGCYIPHHVQLFFTKVREYCEDKELPSCSPEAVDEVFHRKMLGAQGHPELAHMEERLRKIFHQDELSLVIDILTQIAVTGSIDSPQIKAICDQYNKPPQEQREFLPEAFRILEHDGYLKRSAVGKYIFVSNLLREWWRARFEAFFECV